MADDFRPRPLPYRLLAYAFAGAIFAIGCFTLVTADDAGSVPKTVAAGLAWAACYGLICERSYRRRLHARAVKAS